ncbi:Retinol dehydrogenase 11 [Papilio machaon]|uniref:Retinol dehydrogenase 11 n=1 Tax=Papilio machaon TaxID=76193 RepID=A0A194RB30_PAPMA|nr:Retinol dehydrogenase 11 [Papilio machaon]
MSGHGVKLYVNEFSKCETDARLDGKVALVTGATSGIGLETAKNLAKRGAKVIIASRNPAKLAKAKDDIIQYGGHTNVFTRQVDFESLTSIRGFAQETVAIEPRLDILMNNIGAVGIRDGLTEDGLHTMMQVNYFGGFLLTFLLFPLLKASAPSRVINVSSIAVILGQIDFDHWNDVGQYASFGFYSNAKLAQLLSTVEMNKRIEGSGVSIYTFDPGMTRTSIARYFESNFVKQFLKIFGRRTDAVVKLPVFLAADPSVANKSGKHFRDCKEFYSSWYVNDTALTKKLWEVSRGLVGIKKEEDWEMKLQI